MTSSERKERKVLFVSMNGGNRRRRRFGSRWNEKSGCEAEKLKICQIGSRFCQKVGRPYDQRQKSDRLLHDDDVQSISEP